MTDSPKSTHGGPGRGGGRKPTGVKRIAVTLDEATIERARKIGDGNLSEGIRRAVAESQRAGLMEQREQTARAVGDALGRSGLLSLTDNLADAVLGAPPTPPKPATTSAAKQTQS